MKKLIALLCAVCAAAMSLCVACASPLTGDTSNMGLWITLVVVAVIAVVLLLMVGKKKNKYSDMPKALCRTAQGFLRYFPLPYSNNPACPGTSVCPMDCIWRTFSAVSASLMAILRMMFCTVTSSPVPSR